MSLDADPLQTVAAGSSAGLSPQLVTSLAPLADCDSGVSANGTVTGFGGAGAQGSSSVSAETVIWGAA
jgi:hypothetical protein